MDKIVKHIILVLLTVILISSFMVIYNIAFATEGNILEASEISEKSDNLTSSLKKISSKASEIEIIDTFSHIGASGGIGSSGTSITNITKVVNYLKKYNKNKPAEPDTTYSMNVLRTYASIFCLRHHQHLPQGELIDWQVNRLYYELDNKTEKISLKTIKTKYGTYTNTNIFIYSAAFSEKKKDDYLSKTDKKYAEERAQQAIWCTTGELYSNELNETNKTDLWKAGKALDTYEKKVKDCGRNLSVSIYENEMDKENTGTVWDGNQYKIGPFKMSNYAYLYSNYASNFSGALIGGIVGGSVILNDGTLIEIDGSNCKIIQSGGNVATSGTYWNAPDNYNYPWPNSEFYIVISKDEIDSKKLLNGDISNLSKIKFTYQSTRAEGEGWVLEGLITTDVWSGKGNNGTYIKNTWAQPMLAVNKANVYIEQQDFEIPVQVPLVTDVTINKYITKVKHEGNGEEKYYNEENKNDRVNMSETDKAANPVKVEAGDRVTFNVVLTNNKNIDVKFSLQDTLPTNISSFNYRVGTEEHEPAKLVKNAEGRTIGFIIPNIVIPKNNTATVTVEVVVNDSAHNTAKIISRNEGPNENTGTRDYPRTTSGGPIVNLAELNGGKMQSSDYYIVKQYDISLDKYIVKVEHTGENTSPTYDDTEAEIKARKNQIEIEGNNWKFDNPVYIEYGDRVTYYIDIYNTAIFNGDSDKRSNHPYYDPDKVYVDIQDVLPTSYYSNNSDITVKIVGRNNESVNEAIGNISYTSNNFTARNIEVSAGGKTTVEVSFIAMKKTNELKDRNTVTIKQIRNVNNAIVSNVPSEGSKESSSDWYAFKKYDISIDKYIVKVEHTEERGVIYNSTTDRKNNIETVKESNPVHVERGDRVTYNIDIYNTADFKSIPNYPNRADAPYYEPAKVYVDITDALPSSYSANESDLKVKIDNKDVAIEKSSNSFAINEIEVSAGGKTTVEVSFIVIENPDKVPDENKVEIGTIKNINNYIISEDMIERRQGNDTYSGSKNTSSDWFDIKEYNVSIDKYIVKVEHTEENGVIYENPTERKNTDASAEKETYKEENPVHVERGDKITYKIDIYNTTSPYEENRADEPYWNPDKAYVSIKDILPSKYSNLEVSVSNNTGTISIPKVESNSGGEFTVDDIEVPSNGKTTITVTLIAELESGKDVNKVQIINENLKNINKRVVVNNPTQDPSSDWYEIKEYNLSVDKYITQVKHVENDEITYGNSEDRKSKDGSAEKETYKEEHPVYAEYGDRITYQIDVYNTTDHKPFENNRIGEPYWEPDKVYVSIKDTLPNKYSDLTVEVKNGTGTVTIPATESVSGGEFTVDDIVVLPNDKTTITVTLVVEEHDRTVQEKNTAEIYKDIKNINKRIAVNNSERTLSSDWYHINDYDISINKYISSYNHSKTNENNANNFTNETTNFTDRSKMSEKVKEERPLAVEKKETIVYSIRLDNNSVEAENGLKKATSVRPTDVTDVLDYGLKYQSSNAKVYKVDGSEKYGELAVSTTNLGNNTYKLSIANKTEDGKIIIIDPGEYIIYYVTVEVTETNMYLYKLSNMAIITTLTNINHTDELSRVVKNDQYNENTSTTETSRDFVKLKDLIISGKVWLDSDKDGYMGKNKSGNLNSYIDYESDPSTHITAPSGDAEYAMKGITVKLYSVDEENTTLVRTTKTDENGLFTFGRNESGNWYSGTYSYDGEAVTESEQRIPKATNKDTNQNYTTNSKFIDYYIEYEYDGVVYKSTEVYSSTQNLKNDGDLVPGNKYKIDSNAKELNTEREKFDLKYEIVGYNKAYNSNLTTSQELEYEKNGHNSYLKVDHTRVMKARSFIIETNGAELATNCRIAMNYCGSSRWKECGNHWKNWQGLIASGYFDESQFANTTQGRLEAQAYLKRLYEEVIQNLANDGSTQITKYLWLFKPAVEVDKPETEYLKYINLGLEEREDVNISVTQDVYEIRNFVNGEEQTYYFNQNKYALDGSNVDHKDNGSSEDYEAKFYMTRKKADNSNDNASLSSYKFNYYFEDFDYKVDQYNIETVKNYKTKDSELNSEITFRIVVTNNSITDDEPYKSQKDIKVYAGINEVIEYFDKDFAEIKYNDDGTVKTINVKTKDADGYFKNTALKIADAYFVLPNGSKIPAQMSGYNTSNNVKVLSKESMYNNDEASLQIKKNVEDNGYNTVYIRPNTEGVKKVILAEGQNVDIIIKFTVDKPNRNSDNTADRVLKAGLKTAIAEIGAYSTYYKRADGTYYSAGLVDKNSNPGNFGKTYGEIIFNKDTNNKENDRYLSVYEDDTYKTGINVGTSPLQPSPSNRFITGQVWDDARSEIAKKESGADTENGAQYIGDGKNESSGGSEAKTAYKDENGNILPKLNKVLKNSDNSLKEEKDFLVNDVGVKLIEIIRIPVYDEAGNFVEERTYEDTIKATNNSIMTTRTGQNGVGEGKYLLRGYLPGEYLVRFFYGDTTSDQMAIFNGQDYKSTTYQAGSEYAEDVYQVKDDGRFVRDLASAKRVREILTQKGLSDAKDDEIRRLETISYSETLNNNKTLILRGMNSIHRELQSDNTSMKADTAEFLVRTEQEIDTNKLPFRLLLERLAAEKRLKVDNIDFGLQYRPEQQVGLNKFVKRLTLTTSNANSGTKEPLVDAKFKEYYGVVVSTDTDTGVTTYLGYESDEVSGEYETIRIPENYLTGNVADINKYVADFLSANNMKARDLNFSLSDCKKNQDNTYQVIVAGTDLDTENSIGLSNLQYVQNDKDTHDKNSVQGFVFLNIDEEIMQGAEIDIEYLFTGHNLSEIDRVNKNLSVLRLKENPEVSEYTNGITTDEGYNAIKVDAMRAGGTLGAINFVTKINSYGDIAAYSGALTARNNLFNEYYRYEVTSTDKNTAEAKKDKLGNDIIYRIKAKTIGDEAYYGRYLGKVYYTGKVGNNDIVAELKINKILDYVDNNLVFNQEKNKESDLRQNWSMVTASELVLGGYINPSVLKYPDSDTDINSVSNETLKNTIELVQRFSNQPKLLGYLNQSAEDELEVTDVKEFTEVLAKGTILDSEGISYSTGQRSNLILLGDSRTNDNQTDIPNANITKYLTPRNSKDENSFGSVSIIVSKVIAAEDDTENMSYENVGEIVEYSSVTGRVTSLSTTLGNVDLSKQSENSNSPEYEQSGKKESDTAAVERVTLTPPTGMTRTNRIIRTAVKSVSYVGIVAVAILIVVFGTFGGIKLYRKRKIK